MEKIVNIKNLINSNLATTEDKANKVYDEIVRLRNLGNVVVLDFSGIDTMISNFAHPLVNKILKKYYFNIDLINEYIKFQGMNPVQIRLLEICRETSFKKEREEKLKMFPISKVDLINKINNKENFWVVLEDENDWKEFSKFLSSNSNSKDYPINGLTERPFNDTLTLIDNDKYIAIGTVSFLSTFGYVSTLYKLNDSSLLPLIPKWKSL